MKKKSYDIALLLVVLLLFSASLGVLHGSRAVPSALGIGAYEDDSTRIMLTKEDAIDYIHPLLLAGNVDAMARVIRLFDDSIVWQLIEDILNNQRYALTPEQKIKLLLAVITYEPRRAKQNISIAKMANALMGYPVFYYAIDRYNAAIPPILAWAKQSDMQKVIPRWVQYSFNKAIDEDDVDGLKALIAYGIRPNSRQASELLRRVVMESRSPQFVVFLVKRLRADPNYSFDKKYTVLMEAVKEKNLPMVRALLRVGARPDLLLDPSVGSAKQLAFQKGYSDIKQLLNIAEKKTQN